MRPYSYLGASSSGSSNSGSSSSISRRYSTDRATDRRRDGFVETRRYADSRRFSSSTSDTASARRYSTADMSSSSRSFSSSLVDRKYSADSTEHSRRFSGCESASAVSAFRRPSLYETVTRRRYSCEPSRRTELSSSTMSSQRVYTGSSIIEKTGVYARGAGKSGIKQG